MPQGVYVAISKGEGYSLGIAEERVRGYYSTNYPTVSTYEEASVWAADCNANMGVHPDRVAEIVLSTL